ncbi:hypothetical protein FEM48_Zijuj03G0083300 [Ziziphus jujuba var. spinosa]|uniref:Protein NRT1/ PTR FAMILY 2.3-like n=1 Tax=Ziziphus jujuba var. spinosa TaxID=714518 RepID=A0A978VP76_ZIZJJ|nr:hypothetical protein FEM48_Zijuj03G0083300 [Ziziphus jujuba var. spinosa]
MENPELDQMEDKYAITYNILYMFNAGTVTGLTLAASGWSVNLMVFLIRKFNVSSIAATKINNVVIGCNSLFPVVGAILDDSFFGSFSVVTVFSFVSLLGMTMLTVIAGVQSLRPSECPFGSLNPCEHPSWLQYLVLYAALALASLGVGGTRYTIATMGANQFDNVKDQRDFFNWYVLALSVSSIISSTAIVYVQDNVGWGLGFGICLVSSAISLALFLFGKAFYRKIIPKGSPFVSIARVVVSAILKRKMVLSLTESDYYYGTEMPKMGHSAATRSFRFLNRAALKTENDRKFDGIYRKSWKLCSVEEVEDLKTLIRIIPIWSAGIMVSTTIAISGNLTILQALTMNRNIGSTNFKIPAASFVVFNLISTIIAIIIFNRALIPLWESLTHYSPTPLQRLGLAYVINIISLVSSALIETQRLHVVRTHGLTHRPGSVVPMSALWLVIPMSILGIAEAFVPVQIGLYYQEFPKFMKDTSTAVVSLMVGIGFYLGTAIIDLVDRITGWLPNNINEGRVDNMFWLLVVIAVLNSGYYLVCAKLFKYRHNDDVANEESNIELIAH